MNAMMRETLRGNADGFRPVDQDRASPGPSSGLYGARDLSGRTYVRAADRRGAEPLADPADHGGAEKEGAGRRAVEPVPARVRAGRRTQQSRIRAALRDHGPLADRARGVQLL